MLTAHSRLFGALIGTIAFVCALVRADDTAHIGPADDGSTIVSTRQTIRAAGKSVEFHGRPVDLALSPDGKTIYVKDNRGLVVIDAATWQVRQQLPFGKGGGGSMHGIAVSRDGRKVFLTSSEDGLWQANIAEDGTANLARRIVLPGPGGKGISYPCGIALLGDDRALVCLASNSTLAVVDLSAGKVLKEIPVGVTPYAVIVSPDANSAYVSNWGGRHPRQGEKTAKGADVDNVVDDRGITASGCVSVVDLRTGKESAQIETGLHPSDLALTPDGKTLYIANSNSDSISVIDAAAGKVIDTLSVRPDPALAFGSAPTALALSHDAKLLFVANGGNNAVAVFHMSADGAGKPTPAGFIPVGWYPGGIVADDANLYVANVKGLGSRFNVPRKNDARMVKDYLGTVNKVAIPSPEQLSQYTKQALADARVPEALRAWEKAQAGQKPVPVPARTGEPSVFEHVVYILKENRTYDQLLGDMPQGNGSPKLCVFGKDVTPNHHALAEQFVLLDNFYCNSVLSADGHAWATEANVTDAYEKEFGDFNLVAYDGDALSASSSGFLWDNVLRHHLSFRNYGEKVFPEPTRKATWSDIYDDWTSGKHEIQLKHRFALEPLRPYTSPDYPGWNLAIADQIRADVFLKELADFERKGEWPACVLVYLPNDHTQGTSGDAPTPRAMVADNDLALGRVVEGISRSKFWTKTCIFVMEDDPQAGFDHVDGHRSPCLVISPYTKRGEVVHEFYNQTSVVHTIEQILGIPPMTQFDSMSQLMTACFTDKADVRPFTPRRNEIALNEMNPKRVSLTGPRRKWADASLAQDFHLPDRINDDVLNRALWYSVKGEAEPYPAEFAGAHGKGLAALHLQLDRSATVKDDDD